MAKTDDQLMELIGQGQTGAFSELFERHSSRLVGYAHRLLNDKEKAEDIAQEVWIKVVKLAPSYSGQGHFIAWVMTMIRNTCFNELRSAKRLVYNADTELNNNEADVTHSDLESLLAGAQEIQQVKNAIEALPENQRVALVTYVSEDMSYEDLAKLMETTLSSVKSLIFRARKTLSEQLRGAS